MNYNKSPSRKMAGNGTTYGATMGCAHCQRRMGNLPGGYSRGHKAEPLCHPNTCHPDGRNRPNCYELVTRYGHITPCVNKTCYEAHPDFLTYVNGDPKPEKPKRRRREKAPA